MIESDDFKSRSINEDISIEQQSFSESRNKLKHEALYELFKKTVITALKYKLKTWYGYRVIKLSLDNGEIEKLITSSYNYKLGESGFKKLYFMRWSIETKFDQIKNKLELTNFSGKTLLSVKQDFYVCMFLVNMASFIRLSAQTLVHKDKKERGLKSVYKINMIMQQVF